MTRNQRWICGLAVAAVLSVFVNAARAIPAFARKYKTSCATCHEAFPRLSGVGEAFRLNGYKFADDDLYIKDEPVELGDEAYKKIWPKSIWPTDIPGLPPLAIVFKSVYRVRTGGIGPSRSSFLFPQEAKLLGAGAMGEHMSFFFELGFDRSGGAAHGGHAGATAGTVTSVQGWMQFEDLIGPENAFNVRIGTVGMHEMGLFMARDHNRITYTPYLYSSWSMPSPTHHFAEGMPGFDEDTAAFTGNAYMIHAQPGIEVNGFGRSWRYVVGVTNGSSDDYEDNNSQKDLYWQLAWKFGGIGFDGSGAKDDDALTSAESWRDDSVIVSAFGYHGTATVAVTPDSTAHTVVTTEEEDEFWRIGFGAQGKYKDLAVRTGVVFGNNKNPYGIVSYDGVQSCSWFVEAEYFVYPWLIPFVRYETLQLSLPDGVDGIDFTQDRARIVTGIRAQLAANVSLTVEGRFYTEDQTTIERDDENQFIIALEAAF
jgi:hypothetical protein